MTNPSIASDLIERLAARANTGCQMLLWDQKERGIDLEASAALSQLTKEVGELREASGNARAAIKAARDMVPDEEEGLAAQIFAYHLNMADVRLAEALSRSSGSL